MVIWWVGVLVVVVMWFLVAWWIGVFYEFI